MLAASSLCTRRDPIILEGLFELVLDIVWIVGELHEHVVVAGAAATSEARIILLRIVGELHERGVVAGAAATGEARIILARIIGELLVIADAAASGEARIVLARVVGVGGNDAAEGLTFGYVELVARTYDDCPRAKLTGTEIFDLSSGVAFSLSRYDFER